MIFLKSVAEVKNNAHEMKDKMKPENFKNVESKI